jgi:V8-like Glu-specific endopeptidase
MRRVLAPVLAALAVLLTLAAAAAASAATVSNSVVGGAPRVVGGAPATLTDAPWQALVLPNGYLCGGAILDATHVVTAAHCVHDDEDEVIAPSTIAVRAGITSRFSAGQHPTVTAVSVYPGYDSGLQTGDVAILTLATPLSYGATVKAIGLTDVGYRPGSSDGLRLSGWGSDVARAPDDTTTVPHAVDNLNVATLYRSTGCATVYSPYDDNMLLCAGQAGTDACQGDSGGPLAVQVGGVWKLAGIVTGGAGCAWEHYPGYFARVAHPGIHAYLAQRGTGQAVQGPAVLSPPTIAVDAAAGDTLHCDVGSWTNAGFYDVSFWRGGTLVAQGATLTVTAADAGTSVTCLVEAYGSTGTTAATSAAITVPGGSPTPPPAPTVKSVAVTVPSANASALPSPDAAAPKAHVTKLSCARSICTLEVRVDDPAPSAGVRDIEARVSTAYRATCVKRHKKRRCTKSVDHRLRTIATGPATYRIVTPKLRKGTQTFRLLATDRSGHRQAKATTVKKTTR